MQLEYFEQFMLTKENIVNLLPDKFTNKRLETKKSNEKNKKNIVNNDDVLFWTIYKIIKGDYIYETSCNFKTEKDFKIKCIEDLRKIKPKLKIFKLRLTEIEDQLLNQKKIKLEAFFALALLFDLNIFYIWNNKFYEFKCSAESQNYIIKNINNSILIEENNCDYYGDNYYQVENLNKPIKSITGYTKEELILISKKLNINDIESKSNKKEIYDKIVNKIDL